MFREIWDPHAHVVDSRYKRNVGSIKPRSPQNRQVSSHFHSSLPRMLLAVIETVGATTENGLR